MIESPGRSVRNRNEARARGTRRDGQNVVDGNVSKISSWYECLRAKKQARALRAQLFHRRSAGGVKL